MVSQSSIAQRLNLSQRTVSLCLAGSDRVAEATRKRVLETAHEMGYRPNRSALSMRTGRFNAVALLQSTTPGFSYLPEYLLAGLQEGLSRREMHLVLANVPDEKLTDGRFLPSVLREWSVDGFLVNYNYGFSPRLVEVIEENRLPSIWLNCKRPYDCVYPNDMEAAQRLTEHLLSLGHRSIGFFSTRRFGEHFSVADRYLGYAEAMTEAGLPARKLSFEDHDHQETEKSFEFVRSFLSAPDRPTAIVAYETFEAARVVMTAFQMGWSVPRDLSIVTFHERATAHIGFPITALEIPEFEQAQVALDLLMRRIEGERRVEPRSIEFRYQSGASTAPPRAL